MPTPSRLGALARICSLSLAFSVAHCGPGSTPDAATDGAITDGAVTDDAATDGAVTDAPVDAPPPRNVVETVPIADRERWVLPGLTGEAHVVRTEMGIPHIYASNRADLARVQGFVVARDRFFMMDLLRRSALGTLSNLLGDAALARDIESRLSGQTFVTDQILANLSPAQLTYMDAFAEGINAYIEACRARTNGVILPREYQVAAPLLGGVQPITLMKPFTRRDAAAMFATFVYQLGYETEDVGNTRFAQTHPTSFTGAPLAELRRAGALRDAHNLLEPVNRVSSAAGFFLETATMTGMGANTAPGSRAPANRRERRARTNVASRGNTQRNHAASVPGEMLARLDHALHGHEERLGRVEGFGSNAWAVNRTGTPDGSAVIASDGHLPLSVPPLFYTIGLDTKLLGGADADMQVVGITLPGLPMVAVGTNGSLAWGETQLGNDITDWYREEITLDAQGYPATTLFQGMRRNVTRTEERFEVANVPALGSMGRTETVYRFVTFDGRWIADVEGRRLMEGEMPRAGEVRVPVQGGFVVPGDTNGDGKITAISFDYAGLDGGNLIGVYDRWNRGRTVRDFMDAAHGLMAASQNYVAADSTGSIFYTSYQGVPCRDYLQRNADRTWAEGSDPTQLLDGTRYGGFTIPTNSEGMIDEGPGRTDPYRCVVPFDRTPSALDPAKGYVFTANNDPGQISYDNSLTADPLYIGGPWESGFRAARIDQLLREASTAHQGTVERMAQIQGDVRSGIGAMFLPYLLEAITAARTASMGTPAAGSVEARLAAQYTAHRADYDEVLRRLTAWQTAGFDTPSGVATFYNTPRPTDGDNSVATTIFNSWFGRFQRDVFDDEPFPDATFPEGSHTKMNLLRRMLDSRGTNARMLASFNPATNESAYFDVLSTPAVETSREVMLTALDSALTRLRAAPSSPGEGGYGTNDMSQWLWGLRHRVKFESLLAGELGRDQSLSALTNQFNISTMQLPLAAMLPATDPRSMLRWFPRQGDQWVVDAANSGLNGEGFDYGSGPTFRMVISLHGNEYRAQNILPGGQSGIPANGSNPSPHFADQAALWLANRTVPMQLRPEEVVAAATSREYFSPR